MSSNEQSGGAKLTAGIVIVIMPVVIGGIVFGGILHADPPQDSSDDREQAQSETSSVILSLNTDSDLNIHQSDFDRGDDYVSALKNRVYDSQDEAIAELRSDYDIKVQNQFWLGDLIVAEVDEGISTDQLEKHNRVDKAFINKEVQTPPPEEFEPVDVRRDGNETTVINESNNVAWALEQMNIPETWEEYDVSGEGTTVTVLDSGVNPDHEAIDLEKWNVWDSTGIEIDEEPQDYDTEGIGHGTFVSSQIVSDVQGVDDFGAAPDTNLHHGAVLTDCDGGACSGTFAQIAAGMIWGIEQDTDAISMSLGSGFIGSSFLNLAVQETVEAGVPVIASIGNDGEGNMDDPGSNFDTVGVGATDEQYNVPAFSGGGEVSASEWRSPREHWPSEWVVPSITAPGDGVFAATADGGYGTASGTSMSAPYVTSTVLLMQEASDHEASLQQLYYVIEDTATDHGPSSGRHNERGSRYGSGIIDAEAATNSIIGSSGEATVLAEVEQTGEEIQGAEVRMLSNTYNVTTGETNSEGVFSEVVSEDNYNVVVEHEDYTDAEVEMEVEAGEDNTVTVQLAANAEASLDGYVFDSDNNELPGAQVELLSENELVDSTATSSDGFYAFEELYPGEYSVNVSDDEYINESVEILLSLEERTENFTLEQATGTVSGVVSYENGNYVEGAEVEFTEEDSGETVSTVVTDNEGQYSTELDSGKNYIVKVMYKDKVRAEDTIFVEKDDERTENFTFERPTGTVSGVVSYENGSSVEGAELEFTEEDDRETVSTVVTDSEGQYSVELGSGVNYIVEIVYNGVVYDEDTLFVEQDDEIGYNASIASEAEVTATFKTPNGTGLDSQEVNITTGDGEQKIITTNETGYANFTVKTGEISITIETEEYATFYEEKTVVEDIHIDRELWESPPAIGNFDKPQDLNNDGRYEDVMGTGELTIFDVQILFNNMDNPVVQNNSKAFGFGTKDGKIDIFDIQALYDRLINW